MVVVLARGDGSRHGTVAEGIEGTAGGGGTDVRCICG